MGHERAIKIFKERNELKKTLFVLTLSLLLVFAFAASAMAATMDLINGSTINGVSDYQKPAGEPLLPTDYETGTSRIHSHFTQNTNACASCHAVHTAVGEMLLQWDSEQATCEACHNGSLGNKTYNVFDGTIGSGAGAVQAWGGALTETAASASMHNVGGTTAIGAAPGGDVANKTNTASKWSKGFTCASCHDPHGTAGNGRILNPTVNDANYSTGYYINPTTNKFDKVGDFANNAKKLYEIDATNMVWVARNPVVVGAQGTYNTALGDPDLNPGEYAKIIASHSVALNVYNTTGTLLTAGTDYTVDNTNTEFTKIDFITNPGTQPKATYTSAMRVILKVEGYLKSTETVTYVKGMNDFCGACHTDYNTGNFNKLQATDSNANQLYYKGSPYYVKTSLKNATTGESESTYNVLNGFYHEAYRHAVGRFSGNATQIGQGLQFEKLQLENAAGVGETKNGQASYRYVFVCTTCHLSHGANETVWGNFKTQKDTTSNLNLKGITDPGIRFDGSETSANSRLKRMPNMATCETCHAKGDVFNTMPY